MRSNLKKSKKSTEKSVFISDKISAKEDEVRESEGLPEVESLVSLIEFLLQNNDNLTVVQRTKLNDFLLQDYKFDDVTKMRKYVDSILRNTNRSIKPNPLFLNEGVINEAQDVLNFISYTLENKIQILSTVQQKILKDYSEYIIKRDVNITENEVISIQNHLRSAIYKEKTEIMSIINNLIPLYSNNTQKTNILIELRKELKLFNSNLVAVTLIQEHISEIFFTY